ncbi:MULTISPECIES: hypothetical protein [unclassified Thermosynechococcus]|nr:MULTISPECIES: hypothetical protein [unclassified Thermosynechococcus]
MTTILMTQALQRQGEIWHNILSSTHAATSGYSTRHTQYPISGH